MENKKVSYSQKFDFDSLSLWARERERERERVEYIEKKVKKKLIFKANSNSEGKRLLIETTDTHIFKVINFYRKKRELKTKEFITIQSIVSSQ